MSVHPRGAGPREPVPEDGAVLAVLVRAGARKAAVGPVHGGALRVSVTTAPEKGKANRAVLEALARWLGVPRGRLTILRGEQNRRKEIRVAGLSPRDLQERLSTWTHPGSGS